jgi:hypothetical protein
MSISKECQEYHLTPSGWVEGTFTGDVFGGLEERSIPEDRVLTIACYDEIPAAFSKPYYHDQVIWESINKQLIKKLKTIWGERPNWPGYDLMKSNNSF